MNRTQEELEAAAARVLADGPKPVLELAQMIPAQRRGGRHTRVSTETLTRWIELGKNGVFLDGARLAGRGWYSSVAALARFSAALAVVEAGGEVKVSAPCEREKRAKSALARMGIASG